MTFELGSGEGVNVESLCEAALVLALATASVVGVRGSRSWSWEKGRAAEARRDWLWLPLSDANLVEKGKVRGCGLFGARDGTFDSLWPCSFSVPWTHALRFEATVCTAEANRFP